MTMKLAFLVLLLAFVSLAAAKPKFVKEILMGQCKSYNGHKYCLSKHTYVDYAFAESVCEYFNGYLVEINDAAEHDFVKSMLGESHRYIMVSGNDNEEENKYVFQHSGLDVEYLDWGSPEPNGYMDENCLTLEAYKDYHMADYACDDNSETFKFFICEFD